MNCGVIRSAAFCLALCVVGCGSSDTVRVTGSLLKGGQRLRIEDGQWIQMSLHPVEGDPTKAETFPANVTPDGKFEVTGKEGAGIPRGKYRVAVRLVKYKAREDDAFKNAFDSANSPIIKQIDGPTSFDVDVEKPAG